MIKQILCVAILVSLIQADAPGYNFDCPCAVNLGYKLCDCTKASSKSACGTADDQQSCNCNCGTCDELCDAPGYNFDCGCAINLDYKLCDCTKASSKSACGTADDQQSCNCGCGTCDELCQVCTMETYCVGCDYSGTETYTGSMTLEECKAACVADDSCQAIDYSKPGMGNSCYLNFGSVQAHGSSGGYDAWVKSCGMPDCNGVVNGGAVVDDCGVCDGDNSSCADCNGVANGGAVVDDCGECGADNASLDDCGVCFGDNACVDCNGVANGGAVVDECGVCNGDNACVDCNGVANGGATIDQCGVCGGDDACVDCSGVVNGDAALNDCGVCNGDDACVGDGIWIDSHSQVRYDTGFVCDDSFSDASADVVCKEVMGSSYGAASYSDGNQLVGCNYDEGHPEHITLDNFECDDGAESMDDCSYITAGENCACGEGIVITCVENPDCNGVANGDATIDQCGVCDGDNACVDCNGVANGGAVVDECGECGGDGSSCACMNPVSCKGLGQEECEANPEVCTTVHGKNHFKKCKPTKSLMCKSQGTQELCEELCYCQAKVNKKGVFKKCKDKDPADY